MVEQAAMAEKTPTLSVRELNISYGGEAALSGVNLEIHENEIFGIIGPANAGKTSFLKAINRMDMFTTGMRVQGEIAFQGHDVRRLKNVYALRSAIGVVFPLPEKEPYSDLEGFEHHGR